MRLRHRGREVRTGARPPPHASRATCPRSPPSSRTVSAIRGRRRSGAGSTARCPARRGASWRWIAAGSLLAHAGALCLPARWQGAGGGDLAARGLGRHHPAARAAAAPGRARPPPPGRPPPRRGTRPGSSAFPASATSGWASASSATGRWRASRSSPVRFPRAPCSGGVRSRRATPAATGRRRSGRLAAIAGDPPLGRFPQLALLRPPPTGITASTAGSRGAEGLGRLRLRGGGGVGARSCGCRREALPAMVPFAARRGRRPPCRRAPALAVLAAASRSCGWTRPSPRWGSGPRASAGSSAAGDGSGGGGSAEAACGFRFAMGDYDLV